MESIIKYPTFDVFSTPTDTNLTGPSFLFFPELNEGLASSSLSSSLAQIP